MNDRAFESAKKEVADLVLAGKSLVELAAGSSSELRGEQLSDAMMWVTRTAEIIRRVAGDSSVLYEITRRALSARLFNYIHGNNYSHLCDLLGAVKTLEHQLNAGLLLDLRRLVEADIFADFLEMAEHLLSEGYKDAAAVLAGGVLEDSLRKLSVTNGLPLAGKNGRALTIDPMNIALAKASIYTSLVQKQITSWADLRNNAAHGDYAKYDAPSVKQMIQFVTGFCSTHLR